jgi:hypothetical protein
MWDVPQSSQYNEEKPKAHNMHPVGLGETRVLTDRGPGRTLRSWLTRTYNKM